MGPCGVTSTAANENSSPPLATGSALYVSLSILPLLQNENRDGTGKERGWNYTLAMDPPCRQLERTTVTCPTCGKQLQLKSLTYSHTCRQSFHLEDRLAAVQHRQAEAARRREIAARVAEEARLEEARRLVQAHGGAAAGAANRRSVGDLVAASMRSWSR
jgi:hypothetical protein